MIEDNYLSCKQLWYGALRCVCLLCVCMCSGIIRKCICSEPNILVDMSC